MRNLDIRREVSESGWKLWQVAEALGMADYVFSKKLRHELSDDEKSEIRAVIERLPKGVDYAAG